MLLRERIQNGPDDGIGNRQPEILVITSHYKTVANRKIFFATESDETNLPFPITQKKHFQERADFIQKLIQ
jgi:hypothetical protein